MDAACASARGRNASHDGACMARVMELQEHALETLRFVEAEHVPRFLDEHVRLLRDAFCETLASKASMLNELSSELKGHAQQYVEAQQRKHSTLVQDRGAFMREEAERRLAQARARAQAVAVVERRHRDAMGALREKLRGEHEARVGDVAGRLQARARALHEDLAEAQTARRALTTSFAQAQEQNQRVANRCEALETENSVLRKELNVQGGELQGQSDSAQTFIAVLQKQLAVALAKQESLEEALDAREDDLEKMGVALERQQAQSEDTREKLASTEQVLQVFREDLTSCRETLSGAEEAHRATAAQLRAEQEASAGHAQALERLHDEKQAAEAALAAQEAERAASSEAFEKERELWRASDEQRDEAERDMQAELRAKVEKIQELQFGMAEYAKLQQRFLRVRVGDGGDDDGADASDLGVASTAGLLAKIDDKKRKATKLTWDNGSGAWTHAKDSSKAKNNTNTNTSASSVPMAAFMRELGKQREPTHCKTATKAKTPTFVAKKDEESKAIDDDDEDDEEQRREVKEEYYAQTEQMRQSMEAELRSSVEEEVRLRVHKEYVQELAGEAEKRIRRELELAHKMDVQCCLAREMRGLLTRDDVQWRSALQRLSSNMDAAMVDVEAQQRRLRSVQGELEHARADRAALTLALHAKDKLLSSLTHVLQVARQRRSRGKRRSNQEPCPVAVVSVAPAHGQGQDRSQDEAERWLQWQGRQRARPQTAPSKRPLLQSAARESAKGGPATSQPGAAKDPRSSPGLSPEKRRRPSTAKLAALRHKSQTKRVVFGHPAKQAIRRMQHQDQHHHHTSFS